MMNTLVEKYSDLYAWKIVFDGKTKVVLSLESSVAIRALQGIFPEMRSLELIDILRPNIAWADQHLLKSAEQNMGFGFAESGRFYKPNNIDSFYEDYLITKIAQLSQ